MTSSVRVAVAVATIVLTSLVAGTASAAPPQSYDQEGVGELDAANSVETIRHLAVTSARGAARPRRSAQRSTSRACSRPRLRRDAPVGSVHRHAQHGQGDVAERDAPERPQLADELVAERQDHRRRAARRGGGRLRRHRRDRGRLPRQHRRQDRADGPGRQHGRPQHAGRQRSRRRRRRRDPRQHRHSTRRRRPRSRSRPRSPLPSWAAGARTWTGSRACWPPGR